MQTWAITDPGNIREQNQDAYAVINFGHERMLLVVCDGMGGAKSGNVASSLAVEVFTEGTHRALLQETLDTHKAVLEAIKCGDSTWARDAMTLHLSYNRDLYRKMHRARSGEPPLAPKVPEWVLQLKELAKPEEPEEKE